MARDPIARKRVLGGALAALFLFAGSASAEVVTLFGEGAGAHALSPLVAEEQARAQSGGDEPGQGPDAGVGGGSEDAAMGSSSSPVPEPGAWALITLGFVGVAVGVYRRRKPRLAALD